VTKGSLVRELTRWMARATSSFPYRFRPESK
jgi:hypothetical protein